MSDWQERITHDTPPAIRAEHELRCGLAAKLIGGSAIWADLGCGTGLAARAALGGRRPDRALLVDLDEQATAGAAGQLAIADTRRLAGDLADRSLLARIGEQLLSVEGERIVTCFEVVEHLSTFVPLLEWACGLARGGQATFLLSVPNDEFWSIANPYHLSSWGEGAFEELRRLLPSPHTLLRQVALTGSAFVDWDRQPERHELIVHAGGDTAVATHFIAAFGPRHDLLCRSALAVQSDLMEQRRWERQRESNLALTENTLIEQEETIGELREQVRKDSAEFKKWRAYIHELESRLGDPLSGTSQEEGPAAQQPDDGSQALQEHER
ncbi:MAG: class I SAM-dependent methyltransferase [Solirubrobacteraceae bacterium]